MLAAIVDVICAAAYALSLPSTEAFHAGAGVPRTGNLAPLWVVLGVGFLIASVLLLLNMQPEETHLPPIGVEPVAGQLAIGLP